MAHPTTTMGWFTKLATAKPRPLSSRGQVPVGLRVGNRKNIMQGLYGDSISLFLDVELVQLPLASKQLMECAT